MNDFVNLGGGANRIRVACTNGACLSGISAEAKGQSAGSHGCADADGSCFGLRVGHWIAECCAVFAPMT